MDEVMKNSIFYGIIGFLLFMYVPTVRVFVLVLAIVIFIAKTGKNGFVLYFAYSSLGAILNVFLSFFTEGSDIYSQIEGSVSFLTIATIGSLLDLIVYTESLGWNGFENFIAFVVFGGIALTIQKSN